MNALTHTPVLMSANQIKWLAMVAMVIDHVAWLFLDSQTLLAEICHTIGRLVMPVMAYFIASGFLLTKHQGRYFARLLVCGIISQPIYMYFNHLMGNEGYYGNIILAFALCIAVLWGVDWYATQIEEATRQNQMRVIGLGGALMTGVLILVEEIFYTDRHWHIFGHDVWFWGLEYDMGLILTVVYLWSCLRFGMSKSVQLVGMLMMLIATNLVEYGMLSPPVGLGFMNVGWLLAVALLWLYSGQKGKQTGGRWVFYYFYPCHLLVLIGVAVGFDMMLSMILSGFEHQPYIEYQ